MTARNLPHVIGLLLVALIIENFLSPEWDNALVSGHAWPVGVAELVEGLFFVVLFVPVGFVLVRLIKTPNPARFALWFGLAYGVISLVLFRHATTASDPVSLLFFYAKYVAPLLGAWVGAWISERTRSVA
jgi:hypothetical protein